MTVPGTRQPGHSRRPAARLLLILAFVAGLLSACGLTADNVATPTPGAALPSATQGVNGDAVAEATAAPTSPPTASPQPTDSPVPTATARPAATSRPSPAAEAEPGAVGIGDAYFPEMGNGGYDALHYDLTLAVNPGVQQIEGTSLMQARAIHALSAFYLDFEPLTIHELLVDGQPADYEHDGDQLLVTPAEPLPAGAEFNVQVSYQGRPVPSNDPAVTAGWFWTAGAATVAGEPFGAQTWFPANDHPLDKATYRLQVTVPQPLVVASNGLLVETIEEDGLATYVWQARDPMASYLVTVSIDEYEIHEAETAGGLPLVSFYPADGPAGMQAAADQMGAMIDYFEELFGPYPFETYGVVAVQGRLPGFAALETQTRSLFFNVPLNADIMAHELAHQWFGNSVSLETWQDLWLKEGMATYAELLWLERSEGRAAVDEIVASYYDQMARGARAGFYSPPGSPSPDDLYGFPVYQGGAVVLHALRARVGDDAFFQTLRAYTERFAYANASTADLVTVAEEVSGQELSDFLDAWLYGSQPPAMPEPLEEQVARLLSP
ncbi:MAG: M1 family aminopeptidase [Anaerolineae bacterium]|nr:M1 family aminopeptidase [Anaerolineae bacterium]MDX9828632.1 M1 family aminopeptidase [Anaerolineae bacterium]